MLIVKSNLKEITTFLEEIYIYPGLEKVVTKRYMDEKLGLLGDKKMETRIQDIGETKEGIRVSAFIYRPVREDVPGLGDMNSLSEDEKAARLERWTEDSKDVNRRFSAAMAEYTKLHLGVATLTQEDLD